MDAEDKTVTMRESQGIGWLPMLIITVGLGAGIGLWGWTMVTVVDGSKQTAVIATEMRSIAETVKDIRRATSDLVTKSEFDAHQERQRRIDERQTGRIDALSIGLEATRREMMGRK